MDKIHETALFIRTREEESYSYIMCSPKFQDVAYTVDAVVLYISVAVES